MKAVSLFCGAGGMDVGVQNAGFEIVAANELDSYACKTYRENHKETVLYEGDIEQNMDALGIHVGVDLVIGGPPCQGFSVAGRMDPNDPRSKLVFSYCDVVERIVPKAFIMENVKALGALEKFKSIREEIFRRMSVLGYTLSMVILNAKDFGVPQSRERVFIIGLLGANNLITHSDFECKKEKAISLREAIIHLGPAGSEKNSRITKAKITLADKPVLRKSPYAGMLFNGQGRPLNPDAWSSTLPASMGGNRTPIIDEGHLYDDMPSWVEEHHKALIEKTKKAQYGDAPKRLRRLTIDEAIILQSFPSDYVFIGPQSKVFSQIGNAVPCKLAQVVAEVVKDKLTRQTVDQEKNRLYQLPLEIS
ncbi:DNA cytosine methyltransferase [Nissabacter sp. SGAir0207]|uniref:DNA cytosine methyltransferase n=1 Tax=Nissabacter sp. SGAir0207 TaxID=2126321 RepID=UPI0010CCE808|nr:DNA cytosine methyltransferase [Nissabacter sp. SGAir0207]QCR35676.1 DNA (cytosine-5-)-methyltransferase [Nissabacter sp. SGAir0207]